MRKTMYGSQTHIYIAYTQFPNTVVRLRRKSFSIGQNDLMQGPVLCVFIFGADADVNCERFYEHRLPDCF